MTLSVRTSPEPSNGSGLAVIAHATVEGSCSTGGSAAPCAVAPGTLTWTVDGAAQGGNVTQSSSQLCNAAVGGSAPGTLDCVIQLPSFGDEWLTATYKSTGETTFDVSATLAQDLSAPVDLAAGRTYDAYGNVGPGGVGDCSVAAVADWVETTYNIAPDPGSVVTTYRRAAVRFDGGRDLGLTTPQLFRIWKTTGIGGTKLTVRRQVRFGQVERRIKEGYVLYATVNLAGAFPWAPRSTSAHDWIVVGYSNAGAMIESWGEEFQISWRLFRRVTLGIWAIGTTAPA